MMDCAAEDRITELNEEVGELNDHVAFLTGKIKLLEDRWAEVCEGIREGHYVATFRMRGSDLDFMVVGGKIYG